MKALLLSLSLVVVIVGRVLALEPYPLDNHGLMHVDVPVPDEFGVEELGRVFLDDLTEEGAVLGHTNNGFTEEPFIMDRLMFTQPQCPDGALIKVLALTTRGQLVGSCYRASNDSYGFWFRPRQEPHFRPIAVPGAHATFPQGVNEAGEIVGFFVETPFGAPHGFYFHLGRYTRIDAPFPGVTSTVLTSINANGVMSGYYGSAGNGTHGLLVRDRGRAFTTLDVPGAIQTLPLDLNDTEQVVGLYIDATTFALGNFHWDGTTFREVTVPGENVFAINIAAITNRGALAGRVLTIEEGDVTYRGFVLLPGPETAVGAQRTAPSASLRRNEEPARQAAGWIQMVADGCASDVRRPRLMEKLAATGLFCE